MGVYDVIKDAANIAQKADNIELYKKILDAQKEALELIEENRELKQENDRLNGIINDNAGKKLINDSYYFNGDGPYCTKCYDDEKKKILMKSDDNDWGKEYLVCPKCNLKTLIKKYDVKLPNTVSKIDF